MSSPRSPKNKRGAHPASRGCLTTPPPAASWPCPGHLPSPPPGPELRSPPPHHAMHGLRPGVNVVHAPLLHAEARRARPALRLPPTTHQRRAETLAPASPPARAHVSTREAGELRSQGLPPASAVQGDTGDLSPSRGPVLCPASPRTPCPRPLARPVAPPRALRRGRRAHPRNGEHAACRVRAGPRGQQASLPSVSLAETFRDGKLVSEPAARSPGTRGERVEEVRPPSTWEQGRRHRAGRSARPEAERAHAGGAAGSGPGDGRGSGAGGRARDPRPSSKPAHSRATGPGQSRGVPPAVTRRGAHVAAAGPSRGAHSCVAGPGTVVLLAVPQVHGEPRDPPPAPAEAEQPSALGTRAGISPKKRKQPLRWGNKDVGCSERKSPWPRPRKREEARLPAPSGPPPLPLVCGGDSTGTVRLALRSPQSHGGRGAHVPPPSRGLSHVPRAGLAPPPRLQSLLVCARGPHGGPGCEDPARGCG